MHNETLEDIDEECFSDTFDSDDDYMEDDEFSSIYSPASPKNMSLDENLENVNFVAYQKELDKAVSAEAVNKPPELDEKFCTGLGEPSQIWNLMCKKNDLDRIDVDKVRGNIDGKMRAILVDWMMEVRLKQEYSSCPKPHLKKRVTYSKSHWFILLSDSVWLLCTAAATGAIDFPV